MNVLAGSFLSLTFGFLYFALSFALGWEIKSLFLGLLILGLVAFFFLVVLATFAPNKLFGLYSVIFSLPTFLTGHSIIQSRSTILSIGATALCAGLLSEFIVRWRRKSKARSNPAFKGDALKRAP
jgi:hypothetical protein